MDLFGFLVGWWDGLVGGGFDSPGGSELTGLFDGGAAIWNGDGNSPAFTP